MNSCEICGDPLPLIGEGERDAPDWMCSRECQDIYDRAWGEDV